MCIIGIENYTCKNEHSKLISQCSLEKGGIKREKREKKSILTTVKQSQLHKDRKPIPTQNVNICACRKCKGKGKGKDLTRKRKRRRENKARGS